MIEVNVMDYWLVMHVIDRKKVYFVEGNRDCTDYCMGLVGIVFTKHFAK